jgi:hypothetical protein
MPVLIGVDYRQIEFPRKAIAKNRKRVFPCFAQLIWSKLLRPMEYTVAPRRPLQSVPGMASSKCTSPSAVMLV